MLDTPVLLLLFNRPDHTVRVFGAIKSARPKILFLVADGPRIEKENEAELCRQARTIVQQVDWPCDVRTNFSDVNIGCKRRVSSGINWVFDQVEEAIILEDDCLPDPSFFQYCQVMLNRYKDDKRVMHIAGVNFQNSIPRGEGSYYFSKYPHIWGWATWRRAWADYDVVMKEWPAFKISPNFRNWCTDEVEQKFWATVMDDVYSGKVDTWDYQWVFTLIKNGGCCIMPNINLVTNIGFRSDATHTHQFNPTVAELPSLHYTFPDKPIPVALDYAADDYTAKNIFAISAGSTNGNSVEIKGTSIVKKIGRRLVKLFTS